MVKCGDDGIGKREVVFFVGHSTLHYVPETGCFNPFITAGEMKPLGMSLKCKIAGNLIKSFILKVFWRTMSTHDLFLRSASPTSPFTLHDCSCFDDDNHYATLGIGSMLTVRKKKKKTSSCPLLMDRQWELLVPSYHALLVTINKLSSLDRFTFSLWFNRWQSVGREKSFGGRIESWVVCLQHWKLFSSTMHSWGL